MNNEQPRGIMDLVRELEIKVRESREDANKWRGKYYWALSGGAVQFWVGMGFGWVVSMVTAGGIWWIWIK